MSDNTAPVLNTAPVMPRKEANEMFAQILSLDSPHRVLYVHGPTGGEGKTWLLRSLQAYCRSHGILHNEQLIDFYDTANQRVSGVMRSIIEQLDRTGQFFNTYNKKRWDFDCQRARGYEGQKLENYGGSQLDIAFMDGLRALGKATLGDNQRKVALFFDTFEKVQVGSVHDWVLEELLASCEHIAIVIAGRNEIETEGNSVTTYCPGDFSLDEVRSYVEIRWSKPFGLQETDPQDYQLLAELIFSKTKGVPVDVALLIDCATTLIARKNVSSLQEVASEITELGKSHDFEWTVTQRMLDALLPEHRWAVLFMSHLRRRFTDDIYEFLRNPSTTYPSLRNSDVWDEGEGPLAYFNDYFFTKVRNLSDKQGRCVLPHDRVQDLIRQRCWENTIPRYWVEDSLALFPPEISALFGFASETRSNVYDQKVLSPLRDWLDTKIIEYCENRVDELGQDQATIAQAANSTDKWDWLNDADKVARWSALQRQRDALQAEQLLYEMDRNFDQGWRKFRKAYDDAFDAYRKGMCEQLELTVLNALPPKDSEQGRAGVRTSQLREIIELRQDWWSKIRSSKEGRREAVAWLSHRRSAPELFAQDTDHDKDELTADILSALGWAHFLDVNLEDSIDYRLHAVNLWNRLGMQREEARARNFLAESYAERGDFARANEEWELAKQIAGQLDPPDRATRASVAMKQARYGDQTGDLSGALGYAFQAIDGFKKLSDERRHGLARINQARIYLAIADLTKAKRSLEIAKEKFEHIGDKEDTVRLQVAWGEYYRRLAVEYTVAENYSLAQEAFVKSDQSLEPALVMIHEERKDIPKALEKETLGERGTLYRDWARHHADRIKSANTQHYHEAWLMWSRAETDLNDALELSRTDKSWFHVADLLDDLCDLYSDQYRHLSTLDDKDPPKTKQSARNELQRCLNELQETAQQHGYVRFLSRVAEKRSKLAYESEEYEEAIEYLVIACKNAGMHTHSGHLFRSSYDKLVGDLEQRLRGLREERVKVDLSRRAISMWGRTTGPDPQLIIASERVLHPAQARLEESNADETFEQVEKARGKDERDKLLRSAFTSYVEACHHSALRANDSYSNYELYSKLVAKLERRFYDLEDPADVRRYCDLVESKWHEYRHSTTHPTVIEICNRARQMSQLM